MAVLCYYQYEPRRTPIFYSVLSHVMKLSNWLIRSIGLRTNRAPMASCLVEMIHSWWHHQRLNFLYHLMQYREGKVFGTRRMSQLLRENPILSWANWVAPGYMIISCTEVGCYSQNISWSERRDSVRSVVNTEQNHWRELLCIIGTVI